MPFASPESDLELYRDNVHRRREVHDQLQAELADAHFDLEHVPLDGPSRFDAERRHARSLRLCSSFN